MSKRPGIGRDGAVQSSIDPPTHRARPSGPRRRLLAAILVALAAGACGKGDPVVAVPASLRLPDLTGADVDPFDGPPVRATVFIFVRTDCPISNRYAPDIVSLAAQYAPHDVRFWLVYPDPVEGPGQITAHARAHGLLDIAILRDPEHVLVRATGATVTPEAVVYDAGRHRAYRGRIDDRYVAFGRARPAALRDDLARAIEEVLAGRPVSVPTTPAVGCYISGL